MAKPSYLPRECAYFGPDQIKEELRVQEGQDPVAIIVGSKQIFGTMVHFAGGNGFDFATEAPEGIAMHTVGCYSDRLEPATQQFRAGGAQWINRVYDGLSLRAATDVCEREEGWGRDLEQGLEANLTIADAYFVAAEHLANNDSTSSPE